jgi:hypothetical protein
MLGSSPVPAPEDWEPAVGGAVAESTVPRLIALLDLRGCWYESFPFAVLLPRIEPGRIVLPADEPGVASCSGLGCVELPVRHDGLTLGRFVLVPAEPTTGVAFPASSRAEAIALVSSLGARIVAAVVAEADGPNPGRPNARPGPRTRSGAPARVADESADGSVTRADVSPAAPTPTPTRRPRHPVARQPRKSVRRRGVS